MFASEKNKFTTPALPRRAVEAGPGYGLEPPIGTTSIDDEKDIAWCGELAAPAETGSSIHTFHNTIGYHRDSSTAYPYASTGVPPTHTTTKSKKCGTEIIFVRSSYLAGRTMLPSSGPKSFSSDPPTLQDAQCSSSSGPKSFSPEIFLPPTLQDAQCSSSSGVDNAASQAIPRRGAPLTQRQLSRGTQIEFPPTVFLTKPGLQPRHCSSCGCVQPTRGAPLRQRQDAGTQIGPTMGCRTRTTCGGSGRSAPGAALPLAREDSCARPRALQPSQFTASSAV